MITLLVYSLPVIFGIVYGWGKRGDILDLIKKSVRDGAVIGFYVSFVTVIFSTFISLFEIFLLPSSLFFSLLLNMLIWTVLFSIGSVVGNSLSLFFKYRKELVSGYEKVISKNAILVVVALFSVSTVAMYVGNVGVFSAVGNAHLVVDSMSLRDITVKKNEYAQLDVTLRNTGESGFQYVEACIFPTKWAGITYAATPIVFGCCEANWFCQTKKVTLGSGEAVNTLFEMLAPYPTTADACNNLGTVGDGPYVVVVGVYNECGGGYTEERVIPIIIEGELPCNPHFDWECEDGNIWWYDSCGYREEMKESCPNGCSTSTDTCKAAPCNYNGICEFNENQVNCPADCSTTTSVTSTITTTTTLPCGSGAKKACITPEGESGFQTCTNGVWGSCEAEEEEINWLYIVLTVCIVALIIFIVIAKEKE